MNTLAANLGHPLLSVEFLALSGFPCILWRFYGRTDGTVAFEHRCINIYKMFQIYKIIKYTKYIRYIKYITKITPSWGEYINRPIQIQLYFHPLRVLNTCILFEFSKILFFSFFHKNNKESSTDHYFLYFPPGRELLH